MVKVLKQETLASIITQFHAGYVAETVFGIGSISMNDKLDHSGKDFVVSYNGKVIQKETSRAPCFKNRQNNDNSIIAIKYCIPNPSDDCNPRYAKTGKLKP